MIFRIAACYLAKVLFLLSAHRLETGRKGVFFFDLALRIPAA
jgi:hypothetical protein